MESWGSAPGAWLRRDEEWRRAEVRTVQQEPPSGCLEKAPMKSASKRLACLVTVLTGDGEVIQVRTRKTGGDFEHIKRRDASKDSPERCLQLGDLTHLTHLNEPELLECLYQRYQKNVMYTCTGPMLLALNPFQDLPGNYSADLLERYCQEGQQGYGMSSTPLPPHIYKTSDYAYRCMFLDRFSPDKRENQSILVNGESGAGKTESTKHCLHYLAVMSSKTATDLGLGSESSCIENQIIAANPITESLGNATTFRNDNSSRFGKFINLHFCADGVIQSAAIQTYLLETVRILSQSADERNFHIFYEIAAGMPESEQRRAGLLLTSSDNDDAEYDRATCLDHFRYMTPSTDESLSRRQKQQELDRENYFFFLEALDALHFSSDIQSAIFETVITVLHLGNVSFVESDIAGDESALFSPEALKLHIPFICSALSISVDELLSAVARRSFTINGVTTTKTLNVRDALHNKDTLSKHLYASLFNSVIKSINGRLSSGGSKLWSTPPIASSISLLDIFGFEIFQVNSFEQLCINYTNEKLQDHFNESVFRLEQELYEREGLEWTPIDYPDNSERLDLLENKRQGIFHLCNERMKLKTVVSHQTLSKDLYSACSKHFYFNATAAHQRNFQFLIKHYAGDVVYDTDKFLEKNRSEVAPEFTECLLSSKSSFIRNLVNSGGENLRGYQPQIEEDEPTPLHLRTPAMKTKSVKSPTIIESEIMSQKVGDDKAPSTPISTPSNIEEKRRLYLGGSSNKGSVSPMRMSSPIGSATRGTQQRQMSSPKLMSVSKGRNRSATVLSEFSQQLRELMDSIKDTRSHFIRCIKPNSKMIGSEFNHAMVTSQLRCGGVLGAIEVFRVGFPNRFEFSVFIHKYSSLVYVPGVNKLTRDFHALRKRAKEVCSDSFWRDTCRILFRIIPITELMLSLIESKSGQSGSLQLKSVLESSSQVSCKALPLQNGIRLGKTRVFLRAEAFDYLEHLVHRTRTFVAHVVQRNFRLSQVVKAKFASNDTIESKRLINIGVAVGQFTGRTRASLITFTKAAIIIQRRVHVFVSSRRFSYLRHISTWISSHFRGYKCRISIYQTKVSKCTQIQAAMRCHWQYAKFKRIKLACRIVQNWFRHIVRVDACRRSIKRIKRASFVLTKFKAVCRGRSVRSQYKSTLLEMEESKKLENSRRNERIKLVMDTLGENITKDESLLMLLCGDLSLLSFSNKEVQSPVSTEKEEVWNNDNVAMNPLHIGPDTDTSANEESSLLSQIANLESQVEELQKALRQKSNKKIFGCCC